MPNAIFPFRVTRNWRQRMAPYTYIAPALLIYGFFILLPILGTLILSFFEWTGFSNPIFLGLQNYLELIQDEVFKSAIRNNFKFLAFYTLLPIVIGLLLTAVMSRRTLKGLSILRAGFFIPYVMPMVVVGVIWRWFYNPVFGPLNQFLKSIGLAQLAKPWLGNFTYALPAVGIIATWVQYGFCMVLFLAGVQCIDESLYDAAKVDGASALQELWHITIPSIRAEISVALVTTFIAAMRVFDLVYVTTRGGPGDVTMVTSMWLYRNAFQINRAGYAASIAVVQTVIILMISYVMIQWTSRSNAE
jgi:raffinose/stachyose/melibiose transport system permease protein